MCIVYALELLVNLKPRVVYYCDITFRIELLKSCYQSLIRFENNYRNEKSKRAVNQSPTTNQSFANASDTMSTPTSSNPKSARAPACRANVFYLCPNKSSVNHGWSICCLLTKKRRPVPNLLSLKSVMYERALVYGKRWQCVATWLQLPGKTETDTDMWMQSKNGIINFDIESMRTYVSIMVCVISFDFARLWPSTLASFIKHHPLLIVQLSSVLHCLTEEGLQQCSVTGQWTYMVRPVSIFSIHKLARDAATYEVCES